MIPIYLATNATETVPVIPLIDVAPFIAGTAIGLTLAIAFGAYILRKDPTIAWRAQHKSWNYDFFKTAAGDIKILPIMEENISENNTFDYGQKDKKNKGTYSLSPKSESDDTQKKERVTMYSHKGHPAFFHSHDQFGPHSWIPGNSLEATFSPQSIYKTKDGNIREQIDTIQVKDPVPKASYGIFIAVGIVIVLVVVLYQQVGSILTFLQQRFPTVPPATNTTNTCPTGYHLNSSGQCQIGMPFTDLISILGVNVLNMPFLHPKNYRNNLRKYLHYDKTKSIISNCLYLLAPGAVFLAFILPRFQQAQELSGVYSFDITLPVTIIYVVILIPAIKGASKIGDIIFVRDNPWSYGMKNENARNLVKIMRRQKKLSLFWDLMEKQAFIENWLSYFASNRPTIIGDLL